MRVEVTALAEEWGLSADPARDSSASLLLAASGRGARARTPWIGVWEQRGGTPDAAAGGPDTGGHRTRR